MELSAEEEKKRKEKLQRDSDMAVAMETFGVGKQSGIEGMNPTEEEEFHTFRDALTSKIVQYEVCVCVCVCACACMCSKMMSHFDDHYLGSRSNSTPLPQWM